METEAGQDQGNIEELEQININTSKHNDNTERSSQLIEENE